MILYYTSNIRLRFLDLYVMSNKVPPMISEELEHYNQSQYMFNFYSDGIRRTVNQLNLAV
jgi:hypothetical protein